MQLRWSYNVTKIYEAQKNLEKKHLFKAYQEKDKKKIIDFYPITRDKELKILCSAIILHHTSLEFQQVSSRQSKRPLLPNCFTSRFNTELTLKAEI